VATQSFKTTEDTITCFDTIHKRDGQTPHDGIGCPYA